MAIRHRGPIGLVRTAALAGAVLLAMASVARGERVVVVLSGQAAPYKQAAAAVTESPELKGQTLTTYQLADLAAKDNSPADEGDLFIAVGSKAASWLSGRLGGKRLVFCMVADTEELENTANTHGVTTDVSVVGQIKLIHEALPKAKKIGLLYDPRDERSKRLHAEAKRSLQKGMELVAVDIADYDSSGRAIEVLFSKGIDVIWTFPDSAVYDTATTRALLLRAIRGSVPVFGFSPAFVRAGGLLGVGVEPKDQGRQAAQIAADVLAERPRPPVSDPRWKLAVNLVVAEKLSVTLPESMVNRAAYVFGRD